MRRIFSIGFSITLFLIVGSCPQGFAATFKDMVSHAMQTLEVSKDDPNLLILTNATYVRENGTSALIWLNQAQQEAGCTVGRGNLLFFQRPQNHPFRLMLFNKKSSDSIILSRVDHLDQPDRFVSTAAEFDLDEKRFEAITQAGSNPWQVVGLIN